MKAYILLALFAYALSARGFATRYWDCCKPSCSWSSNAGSGREARECDTRMNRIFDHNARSKCDGGPSTTCISQVPHVQSSNLAYAFAAAPGGGPNVCGKCFKLTFDGQGKYETKTNHQKLRGKQLIIMATNIGYDVAGGQFDLMIPGGGVGIFNGCAGIMSTAGKQYGGLLSDCEEQVGWGGSDQEIYSRRKQCLTNKCNSEFSSNPTAKKGCLFLADWMEAAGNPTMDYEETPCPDYLKQNY